MCPGAGVQSPEHVWDRCFSCSNTLWQVLFFFHKNKCQARIPGIQARIQLIHFIKNNPRLTNWKMLGNVGNHFGEILAVRIWLSPLLNNKMVLEIHEGRSTLREFEVVAPFRQWRVPWVVFYLMYSQTPKSLQCLRLTAIPNLNARHDPCPSTDLAKPLSPLETLRLTSYHGSISKWVFLINSQWNVGFIQPFLPRTAESASSPSIVATATAEPGSPTNFAPISFSAWNSAHHRPGKVTAKKEDPAAGRNHQKPAAAATAAAGRI